jgi:hypothetical protein
MSSEIEFAGKRWNNNICYVHENKMVDFQDLFVYTVEYSFTLFYKMLHGFIPLCLF